MERLIAIGDIHGFGQKLSELLAKVNPNLLRLLVGDALALVQLGQAGFDLGQEDEPLDRIIVRGISGEVLEGVQNPVTVGLRGCHTGIVPPSVPQQVLSLRS